MSDPEPRRSVRATKGQHKALEQQDLPAEAPKRRGTKKGKKATAQEEEPEEEVIRCVCGATEQDDHSDEAWIACDSCGAWQHNICMGMSQFEEDLDRDYFCEVCRPENHKELLESIERGEHLWEARRKQHEEEAESKKKKKGGKKGKGKRVSDPKEESGKKSNKQSPAPAVTPTPPEPKKEAKPAPSTKRKASEIPPEKDAKQSQKLRKVSETQAVSVPAYSPPADLATKITDLPENRQGSIKALTKSFVHSIGAAEKSGVFHPTDGASAAERAERLALQLERAVHDTHANQAYTGQVRTLTHNLKTNQDLCNQLLLGVLTPPMLATMSTEELASKELKKETAEMKARAEKQAIKITEDVPRIRRTHKGDEVIGDDTIMTSEVTPGPSVRRQSQAESKNAASRPGQLDSTHPGKDLRVDIKQSPSRQDFDINKVFSSVKSPTASHNRRPSQVSPPVGGAGEDPDVDRLLDDGGSSPPYSPTDDSDPDVIWRGSLMMNTIANVSVTAKHIAGCNLKKSIGLDWNELIPRSLAIAGRIDEDKAITYLCSLRFSEPTDIVVVALAPASDGARSEIQALVDYFVPKKKYGVISDKGHNNVRDTYLVPVVPGEGNHPEFLLNLEDNSLPWARTEPTLLVVIVYRNDPTTMERVRAAKAAPAGQVGQVPAAASGAANHAQRLSTSGPAFSPTSPQGAFPSNYPTPRNSTAPSQLAGQATPTPARNGQPDPQTVAQAQKQGEALAQEVLGPLFNSPTAVFIMPQAHKMSRKEWEVIRTIYTRDPLAREDLGHLSKVLEKESHGPTQTGPATSVPASAPPAGAAPSHPPASAPNHQQAQLASPAAGQSQTPIHPPVRNTPIPPPPVPPAAAQHIAAPPSATPVAAGPPRQTPIPPPMIPPPTAAASGPPA